MFSSRPASSSLVLLALAVLGVAASAAASVSVKAAGSGTAARVAEALRATDLSPAASLTVTEAKGVVVLSGTTATLAARDRAARAAEGVPGVRFQEIRVSVRPTSKADDATLTASVQDAIRSVPDFHAPEGVNITASVVRGVASLGGTVQWAEDKYRAEAAAATVDGVAQMVNDIRVEPLQSSRPITIVVVPRLPDSVENVQLAADGRSVMIDGTSYRVVATKTGQPMPATVPPGAVIRDRVMLITPQ